MTDGNIIPTGPTTSHESDDQELLHTVCTGHCMCTQRCVYSGGCHSGAWAAEVAQASVYAWAGELLEQAYMLD